MAETPVDYTIFWRELSSLPKNVEALRTSFYETRGAYRRDSLAMEARWAAWLVAVSPTLTSYVSSWFWGSMSEPLFLFLAYGGWFAVLATNERLAEGGPRVAALAVTAGLAFGGAASLQQRC